MQLHDEFEQQSLKLRQRLMLVVVLTTLLTAFLSVSLHFWFIDQDPKSRIRKLAEDKKNKKI